MVLVGTVPFVFTVGSWARSAALDDRDPQLGAGGADVDEDAGDDQSAEHRHAGSEDHAPDPTVPNPEQENRRGGHPDQDDRPATDADPAGRHPGSRVLADRIAQQTPPETSDGKTDPHELHRGPPSHGHDPPTDATR